MTSALFQQSQICASVCHSGPKVAMQQRQPVSLTRDSVSRKRIALSCVPSVQRYQRPSAPVHAVSEQPSASSRAQLDAASLPQLKQQLYELVGAANGTDRTPEQREKIERVITQIESLNPSPRPADVEMEGTEWELIYTSSSGNSSGKLGPMVGRVEQYFCASNPGKYVNSSDFGLLLRTELSGEFHAAGEKRINLIFKEVKFSALGGLLTFTRPFPDNLKAHWIMRFVDDELRILDTNQGNVFVMRRQRFMA